MPQPHQEQQQQAGAFDIEVVPESRLADDQFMRSQHRLAVVQYATVDRKPLSHPCPSVLVPMPQLNEQGLIEVWNSPTSVTVDKHRDIDYSMNGQVCFGIHRLEGSKDTSSEALAYKAYTDIFRLVEKEGYPYLLRMWNYLPHIGDSEEGLECYRRFCVGRHRAFAERDPDFEKVLPTATVVGTKVPGLIVYFLAARELGRPVGNPRQVNPYHYPPQYSPRSPSFSRAIIKAWTRQHVLFLSGTASIVGHETRHIGDTPAQLAETLRNIRSLLRHAADVTGVDFQGESTRAAFKVYIRHPKDFTSVRQTVRGELGERTPVFYLNADLCRQDLLVEIEGMYQR